MKKFRVPFIIMGSILFFVIFIVMDNNRIKVVKQEVFIHDLPKDLDGFTILQITDLHEKEFGANQSRLIEKINSVKYDSIVFTGDMLNSETSTNYLPFYSLIEGISNKESALFVPGNADPDIYVLDNWMTYHKSEFISGMEKRGVRLLESLFTIEKGGSKIHFIDFEISSREPKKYLEQLSMGLGNEGRRNKEYVDHQKKLIEQVSSFEEMDDKDILIGVTHYPVVDKKIDNIALDNNNILRDYDLIVAGHYHGGQIRLPLIGALFVPEPWYERYGLFPPQNRVKGLWEYKNIKQYVSTGLGSSNAIPFLKFRLLNTPEINLLTLKTRKHK